MGRGLVLWTKNSLHLLLLPSQPLSYVIVWALLLKRCASALCCPRPNRERGGGGDGTPPVSLTPVSMLVSLSLPTLSPCHGVLPAGEGTRPCPSVAAHSSN